MTVQERWLLAIALVVGDIVAIVVPLVACLAAYVVIVRPPWFLVWVEELYRDQEPSSGRKTASSP